MDFTAVGSFFTFMPSMTASPESAFLMPSRISTVVVLPAPFGPSIPNISPRRT